VVAVLVAWVVNWKQVDVAACPGMCKLLNARDGEGALSETVPTVSLSTVPRLSLL